MTRIKTSAEWYENVYKAIYQSHGELIGLWGHIGLSLHRQRGWSGRGRENSFCWLVAGPGFEPETLTLMAVFLTAVVTGNASSSFQHPILLSPQRLFINGFSLQYVSSKGLPTGPGSPMLQVTWPILAHPTQLTSGWRDIMAVPAALWPGFWHRDQWRRTQFGCSVHG